MKYRIGVDIGGTKISGAIIENEKYIVEKATLKTNLPKTIVEIEKDIEKLIEYILKESNIKIDEVKSVGMGFPGIVDFSKQTIKNSCNFGWENVKIPNFLGKKLGKSVFIENDANAAVIGEYVYNDLHNVKNMILITLGTGIGAGIILNGQLYRGFNFSAGEVGHMIIKKGGRQCSCGNRGCFEKYASKAGIVHSAFKVIDKNEDSLLYRYLKEKGSLTVKMIFKAAKQGDKGALQAINLFIEDLSIGVSNIINIFQPEIFVIGGGISLGGDFFIDRLKELVKELDYAKNLDKRCDIMISKIGNDAGLIGAANIDKFTYI